MFGLLLELNRGVPNGTLRGVRGRGNPPYSIYFVVVAHFDVEKECYIV